MKGMKTIIAAVAIVASLALSGCTNYTRKLNISVERGGKLTIGNVRVTAEVRKGDENMKNVPSVLPNMKVPISALPTLP